MRKKTGDYLDDNWNVMYGHNDVIFLSCIENKCEIVLLQTMAIAFFINVLI